MTLETKGATEVFWKKKEIIYCYLKKPLMQEFVLAERVWNFFFVEFIFANFPS